MRQFALFLGVLFWLFWGLQKPVSAASFVSPAREKPALWQLWERTDIRFAGLFYGKTQDLADSDLNPDNYLNLNSRILTSALRPDFSFDLSPVKLCCKPRLEWRYEHCREGYEKGRSETDIDIFVNEFNVGLSLSEDLYVSYGRDDLQWGPSFLLSPSNPFFSYNGRSQPKMEVPGAGYARLVWSPNLNASLSLIVNTDRGRKKLLTDFSKTCALKLDYLVEKASFSLISSYQEDSDVARLGGYGSWNMNDATILYGEGSVSEDEVEMLAGCSYTFAGGAVVAGEYFYNGDGTGHGSLVKKLASLETKDARESLFRRHYVLLQYFDSDPLSRWNLLLRDTVNLDDESFSIMAHGEYNVGDHSQFFVTATVNHGDRHSELAAIVDSSFMLGLELIY